MNAPALSPADTPADAPAAGAQAVLAVLDDAAVAAALLELSGTLARLLRRELAVVYVESTHALGAAALSITRVLPHAGAPWQPLATADVEQGFRAQAARLRTLTARIALREALPWSLQVMRGTLGQAVVQLHARSDLLLAAPAAPLLGARFDAARTRRRPVVVVVADASPAALRAHDLAQRLAAALQGTLQSLPPSLAATPAGRDSLRRADVLLVPRPAADDPALRAVRCPRVLVG